MNRTFPEKVIESQRLIDDLKLSSIASIDVLTVLSTVVFDRWRKWVSIAFRWRKLAFYKGLGRKFANLQKLIRKQSVQMRLSPTWGVSIDVVLHFGDFP